MKYLRLKLLFSFVLLSSFTLPSQNLNIYWEKLLLSNSLDSSKQSYCFEDQGIISGNNIDTRIKPASVSKLYTSLWALDILGKDHRFQTQIKVINNDLYILGGQDPYFVTENLLILMNVLNLKGYTTFDHVYFSEDFYLNWSDNFQSIAKSLLKILNTAQWTNSEKIAYKEVKKFLNSTQSEIDFKLTTFSVKKVSLFKKFSTTQHSYSFILKSSPLWRHLKQVNMYSNNFYSDHIFDYLGGSKVFTDYIYKKLNTTVDDMYFYTGSGLGDNYTTCRVSLAMLNALEEVLAYNQLLPEQVIAVPGQDEGTLKDRFNDPKYSRKLVAKTGTLNDTSSIAGFLFTDLDKVKFAVFNHTQPYENKAPIRKMQNLFIQEAIDQFKNIITINYSSPNYTSIKDIVILE